MKEKHYDKLEKKDLESLSDVFFDYIKKQLGEIPITEEGVKKIYEWKEKTFKKDGNIPKNIGTTSVDNLFSSTKFPKPINGCHQNTLILKAILIKYGFEVNIIEAIPKQGILSLCIKNKISLKITSHALLKIFINNKPIIIETTGSDFRILNQDKKTGIIDNFWYPSLEGKSLKEIGITSKMDLYKKLITANIFYILNKINL